MAVDMYLKIDGIDGESTDSKHKGEIEIESFSWGLSQTGGSATGGAGAGKASVNDISFNKKTDKASPSLMLACATGQHIKSAQLTMTRRTQKADDLMTIKLEDILISSYQTGGAAGDQTRDALSFNFSKITFQVKGQNPNGSLNDGTTLSYDLKANKTA